MLKLGAQMTNVPELSDLPIIMRRYIEAAILKMSLMKFRKDLIAKLLGKL